MQRWEYLQLGINYYSSDAGIVSQSENGDSEVWKGLRDYLDALKQQGWIMINETSSDRELFTACPHCRCAACCAYLTHVEHA